jgi:hypothetical protein
MTQSSSLSATADLAGDLRGIYDAVRSFFPCDSNSHEVALHSSAASTRSRQHAHVRRFSYAFERAKPVLRPKHMWHMQSAPTRSACISASTAAATSGRKDGRKERKMFQCTGHVRTHFSNVQTEVLDAACSASASSGVTIDQRAIYA